MLFRSLTSNLGATVQRASDMGFSPGAADYSPAQSERAMAETFRPEFINRLDRVIVLRPLAREQMRGMLHKE